VNYTVSDTAGEPIGSLTNVTFGSSDYDDFQYDVNTGRMTQYKFHQGTTNTVTGALGWNSDGTLASLGITDQVNTANSQNCTFNYDDLARLSTTNCGTSIWNQQFGYDPYGNISKTVPTGSTGISFQATYSTGTNSKNWLTQIGSLVPTYDNNGNMTNDTVHAYTWDAEGKMLSVDSTSVKLTYDALGRIVEQNRGSVYTQIVYSPSGNKLALMNGQTLVKAFVPLPGGATAVYAPGTTGPSYWRHSDWLGSSRLATTQSRTKYFDVSYAPYGENYKDSGTTDYSFTGQQQDTMGNYYDFLFRQYSQVQGRWLSPDPAGVGVANPANPQTWNRYAYVLNKATTLTDMAGLEDDGCLTIDVAPECAEQGTNGGGESPDEWDGFEGAWQGAWLDASQGGVSHDLAGFISNYNDIYVFGGKYYDLPGKEDEAARALYKFNDPCVFTQKNGSYTVDTTIGSQGQCESAGGHWVPPDTKFSVDGKGNVTTSTPSVISPTACLYWQMANWQLRGVGLYATAVGVTAEVGIPLLAVNLISTIAQNSFCSGGGATHW